nr:immunoglobulin light chain junction region [Macaca mulatta]MPO07565.1 immunoglobulin light chain junction region [Macaca mulatta]
CSAWESSLSTHLF